MAQKNRANMLTDIVSNIYNNLINFITGQNAQDRFVNLLDSSPNILSDASQPNGYVSTDANNEMFSSYYDEEISRADLITDLTANLAVGGKFYRINDAVGATITLLVIAESNINLYQFAIDATTGEVGVYDITTDVFTPVIGSGNASITPIAIAALAALETAGTLSLTTLYIITDATPYKLMCKAETVSQLSKTATIVDDIYSGIIQYDLQGNTWDNGSIYDVDGNVFVATLPSSYTLGAGSIRNNFFASATAIFGTGCEGNTLYARADVEFGDSCIGNTVGVGAGGFIFGNGLLNTTIESGITGADYTASPAYDFLYNNAYNSVIFLSGSLLYHRYFDVANDRIVITDMATPANITYIGGGVASVSAGTNISVTGTSTAPIINSLSDRYSTSSITSNAVSNGAKTFTVDADLAYIPLQEVLIVHNPSNHMHATVTSYSGTTLVVDVKTNTGSGTYTSWVLNLDGVPIDAITGVGTANEIAYFTGGQVIASLPVATYPSLTELARVKNVGSQVVGTTDTNTLTNKRITARTGTVASSGTPTINTDNVDYYSITALAAAITSFTTNLSGTPTIGQTLWISITDNGTARAITWGASFESSTIALPTTTVISTRLDVAFIWNEVTSKWRCVGTA